MIHLQHRKPEFNRSPLWRNGGKPALVIVLEMVGNSPGQRQGEPPALEFRPRAVAACPAPCPGCREQFPEHQEAAQVFKLLPSAHPSVCQTPPVWALPQTSPKSNLTSPYPAPQEGKSRHLLKKSTCPWPFQVPPATRNCLVAFAPRSKQP